MKLARYWLPVILGFALGSLLSLKMSGTPMRDLLASARAEASSAPNSGNGKSIGANAPLEENDRFVRFFSAVQEFRALKRRSDLHSAIGDLGAKDMEPLLTRIESLRWKLNTNELADVILQRWFELNRAAAKDWIRKRQNMRSYQVLWAKMDPEAALKEAGQNPQLPWWKEVTSAAIETLARGSEDEEARLILQLPDSSARNQALTNFTHELAARSPAEALTFAQKLPEEALRNATITSVLADWARKDVEGSAKEIAARLSEIENMRGFPNLLTAAASSFAKKDINRAFEWIGSLPEHQRSAGLYSSAASIWAATQPVEALQWCADNGIDASSAFYQPGNGSVVVAAAHSKQMETLRWIQSQPTGEMRDALMERALVCRLPYRGAPTNEQTEITLQGLYSLPEESRIRAAKGIGRMMAGGSQSQGDFSGWLKNFQDPALRAATITGAAESRAFQNWKDPANDFSSQFEEGPERDAALRGMTNAYGKNGDERLAADTALRISNQTLQLKALDGFMVEWLRQEPKAATQWLNNAPSIPPSQSASWHREANSAY